MHRSMPSDMRAGFIAPAALAARLGALGPDGALVLLDLDGLGSVNRSGGHEAGDGLLVAVADALADRVESVSGTTLRIAGDEFAVVLDTVDAAGVLAVAHDILGVVMAASGLTACCGAVRVAVDAPGTVDVRRTVRDAGLALRAARRAGPGTVSGALETVAVLTLAEEEDLEVRTLFRSGGFELHYQPLVDPGTRQPVGLEALVRARSTSGALIAPGEFLPQVRRSGLSVELGTAVLTDALETWRERLRAGLTAAADRTEVLLTVNVDGEQVEQDGFDLLVLHLLRRADVAPDEIVLEVTESVLNDVAARARLQRLRDAGVRVAIDDFGAGPVVLSEIRQLPVDILKVDQVLVGRLDPDEPDTTLIDDLQRLAGLLGLRLAVEAVEAEPLAARIADLGVALAQGYRYARPMSVADVTEWLRSQ